MPWPNSLWHLDGHQLVEHDCKKANCVLKVRCHSNNLAETISDPFLGTVRKDSDHWPSRITAILVCLNP